MSISNRSLNIVGTATKTLGDPQLLASVFQMRTKEFGDWISKIYAHPVRSL